MEDKPGPPLSQMSKGASLAHDELGDTLLSSVFLRRMGDWVTNIRTMPVSYISPSCEMLPASIAECSFSVFFDANYMAGVGGCFILLRPAWIPLASSKTRASKRKRTCNIAFCLVVYSKIEEWKIDQVLYSNTYYCELIRGKVRPADDAIGSTVSQTIGALFYSLIRKTFN
jgi:hypothetical protein